MTADRRICSRGKRNIRVVERPAVTGNAAGRRDRLSLFGHRACAIFSILFVQGIGTEPADGDESQEGQDGVGRERNSPRAFRKSPWPFRTAKRRSPRGG
jgi:hypothetical protein